MTFSSQNSIKVESCKRSFMRYKVLLGLPKLYYCIQLYKILKLLNTAGGKGGGDIDKPYFSLTHVLSN